MLLSRPHELFPRGQLVGVALEVGADEVGVLQLVPTKEARLGQGGITGHAASAGAKTNGSLSNSASLSTLYPRVLTASGIVCASPPSSRHTSCRSSSRIRSSDRRRSRTKASALRISSVFAAAAARSFMAASPAAFDSRLRLMAATLAALGFEVRDLPSFLSRWSR